YVWRRAFASAPTPPDPVTPTLVPICLTTAPAGPPIEVASPSGTVLPFPVGARPEVIAAIMRAVEARPC
ncbi:MAG TPA: hypothetical protein VGE74_15135, partial [Gemmata sp.]